MSIFYGFLLLSAGVCIGFGLAALLSVNGDDDDDRVVADRCTCGGRSMAVGAFYPPGTLSRSDREEDARKVLERR